jgi:hypothetical protein
VAPLNTILELNNLKRLNFILYQAKFTSSLQSPSVKAVI